MNFQVKTVQVILILNHDFVIFYCNNHSCCQPICSGFQLFSNRKLIPSLKLVVFHTTIFHFVSAKAIYDNKLLECYFTRSFYKHILGIRVKYTDMESEDYSFYKGLVFMIDNHIDTLGSEMNFSTEVFYYSC